MESHALAQMLHPTAPVHQSARYICYNIDLLSTAAE